MTTKYFHQDVIHKAKEKEKGKSPNPVRFFKYQMLFIVNISNDVHYSLLGFNP